MRYDRVMIQVCVAGVTGWVGEPLAAAIQATDDCALAAAVARRARGETRGDVTVVGSVLEALATQWDVLVDFTSAAAVKENVLAAIAGRRHVVVGSSGLGDRDYDEIRQQEEPTSTDRGFTRCSFPATRSASRCDLASRTSG